MTIAQSKLIEIRNSAARADLHPFRVEAADMIAICDELMFSRERFGAVNGGAARDLDEGKLDLGKPSDIEVIAERLAKVEDLLSALQKNANGRYGETSKRFADLDQRLTYLNARVDKVVDIIGERVSGLVDEIAELRSEVQRAHNRFDGWQEPVFPFDDIAAVRDSAKRAHERIDDLRELTGANRFTTEPAFPTGGAHTAEAAAEAVLPVPQRGDHVRLEGATSTGQTRVKDGWYDVTGFHKATDGHDQFQVGTPNGGLYWFYADTSALKEVRHAPGASVFTKETDNVVD